MSYLYGAIAALVLIVAGTVIGYHKGEQAGANRVQVAWDADKAAIARTAAAALAAEQAKTIAAQAANEGIINDYEGKLAAGAAAHGDLSDRLRGATCPAAGGGPVSEAGRVAGAAAAGPSSGPGRVDDAIAAAIDECRANSAQLDALSAQITPQL